ncbi:MAG: NAD(P)/FAD-dependent oxidoreductase [Bacteroidia bacterium]|nr:NAD(P)/FAD-dependent oxidoreductase [Bacteroidia bacterium]
MIVVGGGASGFFCAVNCARLIPEAQVVILEKSSKLLSKVRISGGGRCNVTHHCFENSELVKNYPRGRNELYSPFNRFSVSETIKWFEERGAKLKTEEDGRMFPVTNTSETIVNCLIEEARRYNIKINTNCSVIEIQICKTENGFTLALANGSILFCNKLVIATGGNSKSSAYDWIRKLGHTIEQPVPSLFTFNIADKNLNALMGITVRQVKIKIAGQKMEQEGSILITHWGLSGPAVLKISSFGAKLLNTLNYCFSLQIKWLPKLNEEKLRIEFDHLRKTNALKFLVNTSIFDLPKRLWEYLLHKAEIENTTRWADLSKKKTNALIALIMNDEYNVSGKTTFKEEFVTCGGINLKEIDFKTMQSKLIPGLFFAGEVLDIDGITGGFNFQNAWTTGWIAAEAMRKS